MSIEKPAIIMGRTVLLGDELELAEPIHAPGALDLSGFVPDELDFSEFPDLIPIDVEPTEQDDWIPVHTATMELYPPAINVRGNSLFADVARSAIDATRLAGEVLDSLGALSGEGWVRPAIPPGRLPGIIAQLRAREHELVDTDYVPRLLAKSIEYGKSRAPNYLRSSEFLRLEAISAIYEASRVADEAARLESALKSGRPVPGGLLEMELGGRTLYGIPDIHANVWGWNAIWNTTFDGDTSLLEKHERGDPVALLGDKTPTDHDPLDDWEPSLVLVADTLRLKALNDDTFWELPGNHDVFYGDREEVPTRDGICQNAYQRDHWIETLGLPFVRTLQANVDGGPFIMRVWYGGEVIAVLAHSSIVKGGMTPDEAIVAPYIPDLRNQLTWNRPFEHDDRKPYTAKDVEAMRAKFGSPSTVFISAHTPMPEELDKNGVSTVPPSERQPFFQPDGMPGHILGQATERYNSNLALAKVGPDFVGVAHILGKSDLDGRNLREEMQALVKVRQKRRRGLFRLLAPRPEDEVAAIADPFRKHGNGGPYRFKQDPIDASRSLGARAAGDGKSISSYDREAVMDGWTPDKVGTTPKGFFYGQISDAPLVVRVDGKTYEIFRKGISGDASELFAEGDEYLVTEKGKGGDIPVHLALEPGHTRFGPLSITRMLAEGGDTFEIALDYNLRSSISTARGTYLRKGDDGMVRLTVHDPMGFGGGPPGTGSGEIPRPTRASTFTPPPAPGQKKKGNGPYEFRMDAMEFNRIVAQAMLPRQASPDIAAAAAAASSEPDDPMMALSPVLSLFDPGSTAALSGLSMALAIPMI